jgi:Lipocalin-like domain
VSGRPAGAPLTAPDLVGTWRLRAWVADGEGGIEHPMGEAPEGVLVYTADGTMVTTIGRSGRPRIDGGDLLGGPVDQRLEAMATFIAYSGTFRVDGGDVVHDLTMSLFPNWVGSTQRRHAALSADGRELTLSADPMPVQGRMSAQRLSWERVGR